MTNNTITARIGRYIVLPVASAGIIAAGALSMAGMANATTNTEHTGPGYKYSPTVMAPRAPEALPGWQGHHGPAKIANLVPGYIR